MLFINLLLIIYFLSVYLFPWVTRVLPVMLRYGRCNILGGTNTRTKCTDYFRNLFTRKFVLLIFLPTKIVTLR